MTLCSIIAALYPVSSSPLLARGVSELLPQDVFLTLRLTIVKFIVYRRPFLRTSPTEECLYGDMDI
jgi:hypothetical protein